MRGATTLIVFTALALSGAGVRGDILENLGQLLVLKERAGRAEAQQETAEWAESGRYMVRLDARSDRAEAQQAKAVRMREGLYLGLWPDYVRVLSETPEEAESALWYSPVGLALRDAKEAVRRGDPDALDRIESAGQRAAVAEARRQSIRSKNPKLD